MIRFTIGTHNLHDEAGEVSLFSDLIFFTEAVPERVAAVVKASRRPLRPRSGYGMAVCKAQPDLVIVWRRQQFRRDPLRRRRYRRYVDGRAKVTPNRGTFLVPLVFRATGRKVDALDEHRINAAFEPFIRGEAEFRAAAWQRHTAGTLATMRRLADRGHLVIAAGDCNTPHGVDAYPGFNESGEHFDRIGSTARLGVAEVLSPVGSDHHRRRAVLEEG